MGHLQMCFVLAAVSATGGAAPPALTFEEVLRRAEERAPALAAARGARHGAEGGRRGASPLLSANPTLEAALGRRSGADTHDVDLALTQPLEPFGQQGLRARAARAGLEWAEAAWEEARREARA